MSISENGTLFVLQYGGRLISFLQNGGLSVFNSGCALHWATPREQGHN
jgi:hypothetical protein